MRKGTERIPGFQEDIHPGVWHRHMMMGAPQKWCYAWMAICGYGVAYILYALPLKLLIPPPSRTRASRPWRKRPANTCS